MAAFMVLPALALTYLRAGPPRFARRVAQLLAGGLALLAAAGWWVAAVLLTPAADRPFMADSTDNNILNLIFGYNGFGRLTNHEYVGAPGLASASASASPVKTAHDGPSRAAAVARRVPVLAGGHGRSTGSGVSLVELLERGASGYRWAAAVVGSANAASMELSTGGDPVMAVGGYAATDPVPSLAAFQRMVAAHEIHYFVTSAVRDPAGPQDRDISRGDDAPYSPSAAPGGGDPDEPDVVPPGGAGSDSAQVTSWVEHHFTPTTASGMTVYDLAVPGS